MVLTSVLDIGGGRLDVGGRLLDDLDLRDWLSWYLDRDKVDRNSLGYMDNIWLLSHRDSDMDHFGRPGMVVMMCFVFEIVKLRKLLLDLHLLHWGLVGCGSIVGIVGR